jgi:hypothetical protein
MGQQRPKPRDCSSDRFGSRAALRTGTKRKIFTSRCAVRVHAGCGGLAARTTPPGIRHRHRRTFHQDGPRRRLRPLGLSLESQVSASMIGISLPSSSIIVMLQANAPSPASTRKRPSAVLDNRNGMLIRRALSTRARSARSGRDLVRRAAMPAARSGRWARAPRDGTRCSRDPRSSARGRFDRRPHAGEPNAAVPQCGPQSAPPHPRPGVACALRHAPDPSLCAVPRGWSSLPIPCTLICGSTAVYSAKCSRAAARLPVRASAAAL